MLRYLFNTLNLLERFSSGGEFNKGGSSEEYHLNSNKLAYWKESDIPSHYFLSKTLVPILGQGKTFLTHFH